VHSARVAEIKGDAPSSDPPLQRCPFRGTRAAMAYASGSHIRLRKRFAFLHTRARARASRTSSIVTRSHVGNSFTPGFPVERFISRYRRVLKALEARRRDRDVGRSSSRDPRESRVYLGTYEVESSPRSPSIYI